MKNYQKKNQKIPFLIELKNGEDIETSIVIEYTIYHEYDDFNSWDEIEIDEIKNIELSQGDIQNIEK